MGTVLPVVGHEAVLRTTERLKEFVEHCGQAEARHDVGYFLSKPGALPRRPHLLLIGSGELRVEAPSTDALLGAVLIFEQSLGGIGMGAFATNDRSGRGTLIAPGSQRARVAGLAAEWLMRNGAHLVLMSFRTNEKEEEAEAALAGPLCGTRARDLKWAWRRREIAEYLPLAGTLEGTLASLGTRTRRNLRYYRRRAETELGVVFVPEVRISRAELLAFNRQCMYAVSQRVAGWRYDSLQELDQPVFMGIQDKAGRWLSLLGGRRYLDRSEILWQMNRDGMKEYSLGTAMRAYFLEHEIAFGSRRFYAEGGTHHSMSHSFARNHVTDLVVKRNSLAAKAMQIVARRLIPPDNELSRMLHSTTLEWRGC